MLRPYDTSLLGSTRTWYSRVVPPKVLTSTMSGTDLSSFTTVQSWIDLRSMMSICGLVLFSTYQ